jgi:murein DD-endopeptidase MepM/ murein hydrolase activator NlpD
MQRLNLGGFALIVASTLALQGCSGFRISAPNNAPAAPNQQIAPYTQAATTISYDCDRSVSSARTVVVCRGDTLVSIAKANNVTKKNLRLINSINGDHIQTGQILRLPAEQVYIVQAGDNLFRIATRFGISSQELAAANGITNKNHVFTGQGLAIPGASSRMAAAPPVTSPPRQVAEAPRMAKPVAKPVVIVPPPTAQREPVGPVPRARPAQTTPPAKPVVPIAEPAKPEVQNAAPAKSEKEPGFILPAEGKIVSDFGPKSGGLHNDGINIAADRGAPIQATADGTVAYAGDGLPGFGNLILIKHADGWTSAYAHADTVAVKRGDTVRQGQSIGTVGDTGSVSEPQLHFELRQHDRAMDPTKIVR